MSNAARDKWAAVRTDAMRKQASLFRAYARLAPWNSRTRQEWLALAANADAQADSAPALAASIFTNRAPLVPGMQGVI